MEIEQLKVRYQRDVNKNYLIFESDEDCQTEDYQMFMLVHNDINGLLKLTLGKINNKLELYYDISSKQKLSVILERQSLSYKNLKKILSSLIETMNVIAEFLLDGNGIIIDLEYIYIHPETYKLYFCYNPSYRKDILREINRLFSKLLEKVNYEDKKAVELIYRSYQCSQREEFQIGDLDSLIKNHGEIESIEESIDYKEVAHEEKRKEFYTTLVKPQVMLQQVDVEKEVLTYTLKGKILIVLIAFISVVIAGMGSFFIVRTSSINFLLIMKIPTFLSIVMCLAFLATVKVLKSCRDSKIVIEKEVLSFDEELEVDEELSQAITEKGVVEKKEEYGDTLLLAYSNTGGMKRLIPIYNNEMKEIYIKHYPYVIGRIKEQADEIIDNPLISRIHLCIEKENEDYYAVDLNSKNGVSVNGIRLEANEKSKLFVGDEVGIADFMYVFQ